MSLTPEEIAMCRDALLEAGVPMRIIAEFVEIRDRIHVVQYTGWVSELDLRASALDHLRYTKDRILMDTTKRLVEEGLARISDMQDPVRRAVGVCLELPVLAPPGWRPPAKEQPAHWVDRPRERRYRR